MDEATSIEDFEHKQKHCEGLRQGKGNLGRNNVDLLVPEPTDEATSIEDSQQQYCVIEA